MGHARRKLPPPPGDPAGEVVEFSRSTDWARADLTSARQALDEIVRESDRKFQEYSDIVDGIVKDLIELIELGNELDIDDLVQQLRHDEVDAVLKKREAEEQAGVLLRVLAKSRPDWLPLINDHLKQSLNRSDRVAAMFDRARWRLMEARAAYQPNAGRGAVHGQATDLDDYLKTLS